MTLPIRSFPGLRKILAEPDGVYHCTRIIEVAIPFDYRHLSESSNDEDDDGHFAIFSSYSPSTIRKKWRDFAYNLKKKTEEEPKQKSRKKQRRVKL